MCNNLTTGAGEIHISADMDCPCSRGEMVTNADKMKHQACEMASSPSAATSVCVSDDEGDDAGDDAGDYESTYTKIQAPFDPTKS